MQTKVVTKRVTAYMADAIYKKLEEWAETEGRSLSSLATYSLETAVREKNNQNVMTTKRDVQ